MLTVYFWTKPTQRSAIVRWETWRDSVFYTKRAGDRQCIVVYTFNIICCSRIVGVNRSTITLNHDYQWLPNIETNLINKSQVPPLFLCFFVASRHAGGFECFLGCELCGRSIRVLAGFKMHLHDTNATNLWIFVVHIQEFSVNKWTLWYIFKNSV